MRNLVDQNQTLQFEVTTVTNRRDDREWCHSAVLLRRLPNCQLVRVTRLRSQLCFIYALLHWASSRDATANQDYLEQRLSACAFGASPWPLSVFLIRWNTDLLSTWFDLQAEGGLSGLSRP